jgi:hypothetical protein
MGTGMATASYTVRFGRMEKAVNNASMTNRITKKEHRMISWLNWGSDTTTEDIRKAREEHYARELEQHRLLVMAQYLGVLAMVEAYKRIHKEESKARVIQASPLGRI